MENCRMEAFPAGLRVLVVDDDPTWLKIIEKMLKKCSFEVTICSLATEALEILRKRIDGFDIVISDVNMPDMDGFKLLELVGLEMNLPVIMMSVDGETSRVMKGVLHGACDYLLKPIRMKELQNIWQHVFRKKIHEVKDFESQEGSEDIQKLINRLDAFDDTSLLTTEDMNSPKKRKNLENHRFDYPDLFDLSAAKKARVVWSIDLHQKFVNAVNQIGLDNVGPKKILEMMNVPWLGRENVASHLQKYRLYLSRLQKQDEPQSYFGVIKQPNFNYEDPPTSVGHNTPSCSFGYSSSEMPIQGVSLEVHDDIVEEVVSFFQVKEPKKAVPSSNKLAKVDVSLLPVKEPNIAASDVAYFKKTGGDSRNGLVEFFGSRTDINLTSFQSSDPQKHVWGGEIPMIQFTQPKEEPKLHRCMNLRLPYLDHHVQEDCLQPALSVNLGTSITEIDKGIPFPCTENTNNHERCIPPTKHRAVQSVTSIVNAEVFGDIRTNNRSVGMKTHSFDQYCARNWEPQHQNYISGSGPSLASSPGDLQLRSVDGSYENVAFRNLEFLDHFDPELITGFPGPLYNGVKPEYLRDSIDYCAVQYVYLQNRL